MQNITFIYYFPLNWKFQCLQASWLYNAYKFAYSISENEGAPFLVREKGRVKTSQMGGKNFLNLFFTNRLMYSSNGDSLGNAWNKSVLLISRFAPLFSSITSYLPS